MKTEIHVVNTEQARKTMKRMKALKLAIEVIDFRFQQLTNAHARENCLLCKAYDDPTIQIHCDDCPVSDHNKDKPEYSCHSYSDDLDEVANKLIAQQNLFRQELEILKKRGAGK